MIRIFNEEDILAIKAPVSDFIFCMGYCEHKIPFYIKGVKVPEHIESEKRKNEGKVAHEKEEKIEIQKIEKGLIKQTTKEEMFTLLPNIEKNIEFTREDVTTKLYYKAKVDDKDVKLSLSGRADKILRVDGNLIIQEDKFPLSPNDYVNRDSPFNSQVLQALIYLNSQFKKKDNEITMEDLWLSNDTKKLSEVKKPFEIPHQQKMWIINIRSRDDDNNVVKSYQGIQTEQDKINLEKNLYRFICLILGKKEKLHHNNPKKCRPCEYSSQCKFSLKL